MAAGAGVRDQHGGVDGRGRRPGDAHTHRDRQTNKQADTSKFSIRRKGRKVKDKK